MQCDHKQVLELAQAGEWEAAHEMVHVHLDPLSCQIHGYLHRVEGDLSNAGYWYRRGQRELPSNSLDEEFAYLRTQVLA